MTLGGLYIVCGLTTCVSAPQKTLPGPPVSGQGEGPGSGPESHLDGSASTENAPFIWMEFLLFSNIP